MSDPEVGEAPGRDMSDPDVSEAPEPASEDKEQRRRRKKERKRRTPEEKEERRRRKEAAANAAANVDANVRADDSAAEVDADADGAISGTTPAGSPSVKFSASSRKSPDVDVEKGAVVDEKLKIAYDGPTFVPPSKSAALQHARETNVLRRRAGISVYLEDECLEDMDGDEILTEIYPQCERRGIAVTKVVKTSKRAATVEDVLFSQAADLEAMGLTVGGKKLACVAETLPEPEEGEEGERPAGADGLPDLSHPYVLSKTGSDGTRGTRRGHWAILPLFALGGQMDGDTDRRRGVHDHHVRHGGHVVDTAEEGGADRVRDPDAGRGGVCGRKRKVAPVRIRLG